MDALTIRPATPADVAALSELIRRTVRRSNASDYAAPVVELICANYAPDKVAQRLLERDVFVCLEGHRIVGTIGLESDRLRSLFVEPGLQGKGVGARLVAHLEAHARQAGVAELQLSSSITARGFYERLGYRLIRFDERPDGSTFLMSKMLTTC
jgi:N-acetylglutamate synthase-like GNAT family acetyltransferase